MKKAVIILISIVMITNTSCTGQSKILGESPLELESFDFATNIQQLIPEKYLYEYGFFNIPAKGGHISMQRDTIYSEQINDRMLTAKIPENAKWLEYRYRGDSSDGLLAVFGEYSFETINFATTLDNKIMVVNSRSGILSKDEQNQFLRLLTTLYGNDYSQSTGSHYPKDSDIYTWTLNDRIVKWSLLGDTEHNIYQGYISIIKKEYADKIGKFSVGNLIYCK
jgi:hypothetical protein